MIDNVENVVAITQLTTQNSFKQNYFCLGGIIIGKETHKCHYNLSHVKAT